MSEKEETIPIPGISVIIPCYNVENYIRALLDCLVKQTYDNWEALFVDDLSTDNTPVIIKDYSDKDQRIKLIKRYRSPKGSPTCRNIGLQHAMGKYIIHFDSDDIIEPFCLQQRVEYMENNPTVDYATFPAESALRTTNGISKTGKKWGLPTGKDLLDSFLGVRYPFSVWNNIYSSSRFKSVLWDEKVRIYTDFSFIIPVILAGFKHAFADGKTDYYYCTGNKTAMTSDFIADGKFNSTLYLFEKTFEQLQALDNAEKHIAVFKGYFLLQMQRVCHDGSWEQIQTFYSFLLKKYPRGNHRLAFVIFVISIFYRIGIPYRKAINPLFIVFFETSSFPKAIKNKWCSIKQNGSFRIRRTNKQTEKIGKLTV